MVKEYGYEYDTVLDKSLYEKTRGQVTYNHYRGAMCLRSGRDALKTVAREFEPAVVLMPALACDSMITPFELYGHSVKYYRLKRDYSIDLEFLNQLLDKLCGTVLFLFMDYFGNKSLYDEELATLRNNYKSLVFIEDRTHNLFAKNNRKFKSDYLVASLRKWIDIPDGGLLWTEKSLKKVEFNTDLEFSETRLKAQCMRNTFLQTNDSGLKKAYRKILSTVTDTIDADPLPGLMSRYAYDKACRENIDEIINIRQKNALALIDELSDFHFVQNGAGRGDVYVAVLIENRDIVQKKLAEIGIFCTIIWPLNDEQRSVCSVARDTEAKMLTIYCDQRYTVDDMKYVASCIRRMCNE